MLRRYSTTRLSRPPPPHRFSLAPRRMSSAIVGDSGRSYTYVNGAVLRKHPQDSRFDIYKAKSADNKSFVFKHVPKSTFDLSQRLAHDFPSSQRLRMHVDSNAHDSVLVYPYFQDTLLALLEADPDFPPDERLKIMRRVGEATHELHSKNWIHTDIKPDNILVNWTSDGEGNKVVTDVALGDFDIASKIETGKPRHLPSAVGNAMWRSPESQTGVSTKASDIYSLGLVYIYVLGGGDLLLLRDYQELVRNGILPEQEILAKHFCYFGPVPESLFAQVDEKWRDLLQVVSEIAEREVEERPSLRLAVWGEELGQTAVDLLSRMTNLDPQARMKIDQVLESPYWQE